MVVWELPPTHLCRAGSTLAATASCPHKWRWGACTPLLLHPDAVDGASLGALPSCSQAGQAEDAGGPCQCHDGRVALKGRGDTSLCIPPPFPPFPIPAFTSGSRVGVPEQFQQQQQEPSPSCPHCCATPPLPSASASVSLPGSSIKSEHGPRFGSALHGDLMEELSNLVAVLPFPKIPGSLLPALQLGSGLRRWLGEGFFPGCNFSLLHTVCFEQCLEASHPRLTAGAGECAGCQPREAPAPDPSSLGEITAN